METLQNIFQAQITQRLGWTLVHFVWQAAAIALLLAITLKILRKSSANLRYVIACMALALIVLMPAVTIRMVDVSVIETIEPVKQAPVDIPKASPDIQAVVEMPDAESPPVQVAAAPKIPLKDRFIEAVEPALPYLVVGWLVGVFGLSLWHLGGWRQLQRLRRQMVKEVAPALKAKLQQLSNALGIRKTIDLVESALVQVPTVVGHLKPVILLPASALTGLSSDQIEAILAHELAHIKRCDYLVNILQTVVEILGFYHPAVWWISHKIRVERENCCDDIAVSLCSDRVCYARALTSMEEIRADQPALAVAASGGSLLMRIRRLLGKDSADKAKLSWVPSVIAILLILSLMIPVAFAMSKSKSQNPAVQVEGDAIVNRLSRLIKADLPDSASNIRFHVGGFGTTSKALARFDIPLSDLKILLSSSERLPEFSQLKDDPKIRDRMMDTYNFSDLNWWRPQELKTTVFGHWEEGYRAPENERIWIHSELQICCSEIEKDLMRVYIGSWSDGDLIHGKAIKDKPQNELKSAEKTAVQTEGEDNWGEEVNGLRAAVEFVPEKELYSMGESFEVRFHVQNVSDHDIQIVSLTWRQDCPFVEDDKGNDVWVSSCISLGYMITSRQTLKPGETAVLKGSGIGFGELDANVSALHKSFNKTKALIGNIFRCKPGQYFIHYDLKLPGVSGQPDCWRGRLKTGKRKITITPRQKPNVEVEGEKIDKADKVKRGAREAIEKFVAAATAGDIEKAGEFAHPRRLPASQIADITEIAKGQNLRIMAVVADDFSAMAVSSVIQGERGRMGPLVFSLDREVLDGRDNWWVHDIDMETPDSAEVELKRFLQKHPKAQKVPSEDKPAGQVEGEGSLEDKVEELSKQAREDLYEEMIKKDAREFAKAYLSAFKNKDWNLAASMCRPGSKQARNAPLLGKMCDFNDSIIGTVYSNGEIALATTEQLKQVDGRQWQFAFTLTKQEKGWLVKDIDWLPPGKKTQEIEKFRKAFPKAQLLAQSKSKPAVQVEGENEGRRRTDAAKWTEGKAMMGTLATVIRAWTAETNPDGNWDSNSLTYSDFGFVQGDLTGNYFDESNFSWVVTRDRNAGKLLYTIKATAGKGIKYPAAITLDEKGNWTEEQPEPSKKPGVEAEDVKARIQTEFTVCEVLDTALDWETRTKIKNLMGETTGQDELKEDVSAKDILQDVLKNKLLEKDQSQVLIDLLCSKGYIKIISRPTIETFDGEVGTIKTAEEIPFVSGYTEPNEPGQQPQPIKDSFKPGVNLQVLARTHTDPNNILLEIDFESTKCTRYEKQMYKGKYPYELPITEISRIKSRILIESGQTVCLGGSDTGPFFLIKAEKLQP